MGYKAIAIPVTYNADHVRFLTVRDSRFNDWTFVTGGCRKREVHNPIRCALRELSEESRGCFRLYEGQYISYSFRAVVNSEMHTYNVFFFRVSIDIDKTYDIINDFNHAMHHTWDRKRKGMAYRIAQDENNALSWDTIDALLSKPVWDVTQRVVQSKMFKAVLKNDPDVQWKTFSPSVVYG